MGTFCVQIRILAEHLYSSSTSIVWPKRPASLERPVRLSRRTLNWVEVAPTGSQRKISDAVSCIKVTSNKISFLLFFVLHFISGLGPSERTMFAECSCNIPPENTNLVTKKGSCTSSAYITLRETLRVTFL